jgi:hypothetical protein
MDKLVVDVFLGIVNVEFRRFQETKEEFIHNLEMGPGQFQDRFVFFRIKCIADRIDLRRYGSEEVDDKLSRNKLNQDCTANHALLYHVRYLRVHRFSQDTTIDDNVFQDLLQSMSLDFLLVEFGRGIAKVKHHHALSNLLYKQILA